MEDALAYAREHASVDESRIYLLGYSGGAMNALHLASRHPDTFAGVAAWVPVYDLVSWHAWHLESGGEEYAEQIAGACGGVPEEGSEAQDECAQRSPKAHVPAAEGEVRIMIAHGIDDDVVPVEHGLWAFMTWWKSPPASRMSKSTPSTRAARLPMRCWSAHCTQRVSIRTLMKPKRRCYCICSQDPLNWSCSTASTTCSIGPVLNGLPARSLINEPARCTSPLFRHPRGGGGPVLHCLGFPPSRE